MLRKPKLMSFLLPLTMSVGTAVQADTSEDQAESPRLPSGTCQVPTLPALYDAPTADNSQSIEVDPTITVHAQSVEYLEGNRLELAGDVEIIKQGYYARSDRASIDQFQNEAELEGGIMLQGPNMHMTSDAALVNLTKGSAKLQNAEYIDPETGFRGAAALVDQRNQQHLVIEDGSFTTCQEEVPDWSFRASEISLNQDEGFGTASHARFNVLDVPVFYIPWFSFPIDDRRKSGFLYPTIGSSDAGSGVFVSLPYYFNLAPNYDATLTSSWIDGRGAHEELELRHKGSLQQSSLVLGYIDEDKAFEEDQRKLGFSNENGQRWGLGIEQAWNFDQYLQNTRGALSFTQISDRDYIDDLDQGLQVANKDMLERRLTLHHSADRYRVEGLVQQFESLSDTTSDSDQPYQRLPELNFELYSPYEGYELDWNSQYVYFYRDQDVLVGDERVRGSRLRHRPSVALPMRNSWAYATPKVSIDHTDYYLEDYSASDKHVSRTIPVLELDAGMAFDRTPTLLPDGYTNSLEPRIYYVYSDYVDQSALPNFDTSIPSFNYDYLFRANRFTGGDRVSDENRLTLSVTSRYTDWNRGLDVVSVSLGQVSQFEKRKVSSAQNQRILDGESLLASELTVRPTHNWIMRFSNLWDASKDETEESVSSLSYRSGNEMAVLNLAHRYRRDEIEQSDASVIYPINREFSALGQWRYDLESHRTIGTLAGVEYTSCCWRVQVIGQRYLTDTSEMDNAILFRFQLRGLGGFGVNDTKMDSLIPGYQRREEQIR